MGGARRARAQRRRPQGALAIVAALALGTAGVLLRRRKAHDERRTMSDSNKATSRRVLEDAFNQGKLDVIDELVTPKAVGHDPSLPEDMIGPEGLKAMISGYRTAFPDVEITVEQQIGEGDLVATRWRARGTHEGDLMGMAATGKQVTITGITIDRFENDRIAESWTNWDTLGMLQQLGAIPTMAQA
jgi:steroid delta-isomerase-like uncharacterized protein